MWLFARSLSRRDDMGQPNIGWIGELWQAIVRYPWRFSMVFVGAVLILYVTLDANASAVRPSRLLILWFIGLLAVLFAFAQRPPFRCRYPSPEAVLILFLTSIAALARFPGLDHFPPVLTGDEAAFGLEALRVLKGTLQNPFGTGWLSHPSLYVYLQAFFVRWLGRTPKALRLSSALISVGTVPLLYLYARQHFGRSVAAMATAFFCCYHFAIHFGRMGLNNIWDPFWALATLICFDRALVHRSPFGYALAGVSAGLAMYFYMGARLVPVLLVVDALVWLCRDPRRWREQRLYLGITFGVMALTALPLLNYFRLHPGTFSARWNWVGIFPSGWVQEQVKLTGKSVAQILLDQFLKSALAFFRYQDPTFFYRPGIPLLQWPAGVLLTLGLVYGSRKRRWLAGWFVVFWLLLVIIFGGVLLENPPASPRYVLAIPPVCILLALGIRGVAQALGNAWSWSGFTRGCVQLLLITALCVMSLWFYFVRYPKLDRFADRNTRIAHAVGTYLVELDANYRCYFYGAPALYFRHPTLLFLAEGVVGIDVEPMQLPKAPELATGGIVHVFTPERAMEAEQIRRFWPGGELYRFYDRRGSLLFVVYKLAAIPGVAHG